MLDTYIEENAIKTPDGLVTLNDLCGSYRVWLMQRGHRAPERNQIEAELKALGYEVGQHYSARIHILGLTYGPRYKVENGKIRKVRK